MRVLRAPWVCLADSLKEADGRAMEIVKWGTRALSSLSSPLSAGESWAGIQLGVETLRLTLSPRMGPRKCVIGEAGLAQLPPQMSMKVI